MEATDNVAVAINGNKREDFEAGDKVLVTFGEHLSLLRLGFSFVGEAEVTYSDIESLIVTPEQIAEKLAKETEALKSQAQKNAEAKAKKDAEEVEKAEKQKNADEEKAQKEVEARKVADQKKLDEKAKKDAEEAEALKIQKEKEAEDARLAKEAEDAEKARIQAEKDAKTE